MRALLLVCSGYLHHQRLCYVTLRRVENQTGMRSTSPPINSCRRFLFHFVHPISKYEKVGNGFWKSAVVIRNGKSFQNNFCFCFMGLHNKDHKSFLLFSRVKQWLLQGQWMVFVLHCHVLRVLHFFSFFLLFINPIHFLLTKNIIPWFSFRLMSHLVTGV